MEVMCLTCFWNVPSLNPAQRMAIMRGFLIFFPILVVQILKRVPKNKPQPPHNTRVLQLHKMTCLLSIVNVVCCSHQFCILPSRRIIVEALTTPLLPAFCILRQAFLLQEYRVWHLHLLLCHPASRIW